MGTNTFKDRIELLVLITVITVNWIRDTNILKKTPAITAIAEQRMIIERGAQADNDDGGSCGIKFDGAR